MLVCTCAPAWGGILFASIAAMKEEMVHEFVLMLPLLDDKENKFMNSYYAIGSKWSERNHLGKFVFPNLEKKPFQPWLPSAGTSPSTDP